MESISYYPNEIYFFDFSLIKNRLKEYFKNATITDCNSIIVIKTKDYFFTCNNIGKTTIYYYRENYTDTIKTIENIYKEFIDSFSFKKYIKEGKTYGIEKLIESRVQCTHDSEEHEKRMDNIFNQIIKQLDSINTKIDYKSDYNLNNTLSYCKKTNNILKIFNIINNLAFFICLLFCVSFIYLFIILFTH